MITPKAKCYHSAEFEYYITTTCLFGVVPENKHTPPTGLCFEPSPSEFSMILLGVGMDIFLGLDIAVSYYTP